MIETQADVAVLGSGFAGSLTCLILHRLGLRSVLIDKAEHPRFAIGESSTPIGNMVLRDLARRYDLPQIEPLTRYGSWKKSHPNLRCGRKRGFSYFKHDPGRPFAPRSDHANELLVTASADDEHSDTHWLRADVDRFLAGLVTEAGIPFLERTHVDRLHEVDGDRWELSGTRDAEAVRVRARFLIDATGAAGVVPRALGVGAAADFATHSRAIFAHFHDVAPWHEVLRSLGADTAEHPFCSDDAAQHHVLDGAWLWMLRFDGGLTSVGLVLDDRRHPQDRSVAAGDEWRAWLARYPSLEATMARATIAGEPGRLIRTGRLQRRWRRIAGRNWAALPHTAGFVDPLHSTGIAHTLCGIERLTDILAENWAGPALGERLGDYQHTVFVELALIDRLVAGCFEGFGNFRAMVAYAMLYFAAATTYERRRAAGGAAGEAFLCAGDARLQRAADDAFRRLSSLAADPGRSGAGVRAFEAWIARAIEPFNRVGLCDRQARNLYRYTAAPAGHSTPGGAPWPARARRAPGPKP